MQPGRNAALIRREIPSRFRFSIRSNLRVEIRRQDFDHRGGDALVFFNAVDNVASLGIRKRGDVAAELSVIFIACAWEFFLVPNRFTFLNAGVFQLIDVGFCYFRKGFLNHQRSRNLGTAPARTRPLVP
jgi:hypothetical protein